MAVQRPRRPRRSVQQPGKVSENRHDTQTNVNLGGRGSRFSALNTESGVNIQESNNERNPLADITNTEAVPRVNDKVKAGSTVIDTDQANGPRATKHVMGKASSSIRVEPAQVKGLNGSAQNMDHLLKDKAQMNLAGKTVEVGQTSGTRGEMMNVQGSGQSTSDEDMHDDLTMTPNKDDNPIDPGASLGDIVFMHSNPLSDDNTDEVMVESRWRYCVQKLICWLLLFANFYDDYKYTHLELLGCWRKIFC